jgi:hypothetical protein
MKLKTYLKKCDKIQISKLKEKNVMNDIIPLMQASIYIIVAIMFGMVGLYFYLLRGKTSKDRNTSSNNRIETPNENNDLNNNDEDDPIQKF